MDIVQAYKAVINDLSTQQGYEQEAKDTAIAVLTGRLVELVFVWGHPDTNNLFDSPNITPLFGNYEDEN